MIRSWYFLFLTRTICLHILTCPPTILWTRERVGSYFLVIFFTLSRFFSLVISFYQFGREGKSLGTRSLCLCQVENLLPPKSGRRPLLLHTYRYLLLSRHIFQSHYIAICERTFKHLPLNGGRWRNRTQFLKLYKIFPFKNNLEGKNTRRVEKGKRSRGRKSRRYV